MIRALNVSPIDDIARDGRYQLVFAADAEIPDNPPFALAKFVDGSFRCSSGAALGFEPTHYQVKEGRCG